MKFDVEMLEINEMMNEQGVEPDSYYLVAGYGEFDNVPQMHVAMYSDLDKFLDKMTWLTAEGLHILKPLFCSRYPLPTVDEEIGIIVSDYTL